MRRSAVVLLVFAIIVLGGSLALWWWAVTRLRAGFTAWASGAAAQGLSVHAAVISPAGWPGAAELRLSDLVIRAGPDVVPGGAAWTAERAALRLSPLAPEMLTVRLEGTQRVEGLGGASLPFVADRFVLAIPLRDDGPVQWDARRLRFQGSLAGMTVGLLEGQAQSFTAAGPGRPALTFTVSAEAITLPPPPAPQPPLGNHIASATVEGAIDGVIPPPSPDMAARAAAWQRSGGLLRVQHMAIGWGPLGVSGTAAVGLDAALQPSGTASLRVIGYDAALQQLAAEGTIRPEAARAIRGVLGLLARTSAGSDVTEVDLPLAWHDGVLSVGRIPVGKIPPVVWQPPP